MKTTAFVLFALGLNHAHPSSRPIEINFHQHESSEGLSSSSGSSAFWNGNSRPGWNRNSGSSDPSPEEGFGPEGRGETREEARASNHLLGNLENLDRQFNEEILKDVETAAQQSHADTRAIREHFAEAERHVEDEVDHCIEDLIEPDFQEALNDNAISEVDTAMEREKLGEDVLTLALESISHRNLIAILEDVLYDRIKNEGPESSRRRIVESSLVVIREKLEGWEELAPEAHLRRRSWVESMFETLGKGLEVAGQFADAYQRSKSGSSSSSSRWGRRM